MAVDTSAGKYHPAMPQKLRTALHEQWWAQGVDRTSKFPGAPLRLDLLWHVQSNPWRLYLQGVDSLCLRYPHEFPSRVLHFRWSVLIALTVTTVCKLPFVLILVACALHALLFSRPAICKASLTLWRLRPVTLTNATNTLRSFRKSWPGLCIWLTT